MPLPGNTPASLQPCTCPPPARAERGSIGASSEGEGPAEEADEEGSTATDEEDEEEDDDEEYELDGEHRSLSSVVKIAWAGARHDKELDLTRCA